MIRAWLSVHSVRTALGCAAAVFVLAIPARLPILTAIGHIELPMAMPLAVVMPALAVTVLVTGAVNHAPRHTELLAGRPGRMLVARTVWVHTLLVVTAASCLPLGWTGAEIEWSAIAANLLLYCGLSLVVVVAGRAPLAWLAPMLLVMASMFAGRLDRPPGYRWWAVSITPEVTGGRVAVSVVIWCVAAGMYVWRGGYLRQE